MAAASSCSSVISCHRAALFSRWERRRFASWEVSLLLGLFVEEEEVVVVVVVVIWARIASRRPSRCAVEGMSSSTFLGCFFGPITRREGCFWGGWFFGGVWSALREWRGDWYATIVRKKSNVLWDCVWGGEIEETKFEGRKSEKV